MKRRLGITLVVAAVMIAIAAIGARKEGSLLVLEWAAKAAPETPPVAILIELGVKDDKPTDWPGRATVNGAKVVHREGHRFQKEDKLIDPDAWKVSSHRPVRVPAKQPAVARVEGIMPAGIVLHLSDVKPDATLTIESNEGQRRKATVSLKDVLAGKRVEVWDGEAVVRLVTTTTALTSGKTEDDFPTAAYGPDGTLWVAYISYTVKEESRRIEAENLKKQPENFKAYDTPEFGDQLWVKYYKGGKWSEPLAVTEPRESLDRCAITVEGNGTVWIAYSAFRKGEHMGFVRTIESPFAREGVRPQVGAEKPLGGGIRRSPVLCTNQNGEVITGGLTDESRVAVTNLSVKDPVSIAGTLARGTQWHPALAPSPNGPHAFAFDTYKDDYDVRVAGAATISISSARFEARPSITYDAAGRLWIAYEEGPQLWGKDWGPLVPKKGNPLYSARSVRVVCLQDGKLMRPIAELPTSTIQPPEYPNPTTPNLAYERAARYSQPQIGLDGKGRVWLTYRQKYGSRYSTHPGSYWITWARRLDGDKWSEPIEVHHSDGLLDNRPVLLPHSAGGLRILHSADGRYSMPEQLQNRIYSSYIDLPGEPVEPKLEPHEVPQKDPKAAEQEQAAVTRIRDYRIDAGGEKYQLLRGEFHRHTEISWDGGPDGSLEDMFRYAIDAAAMDWIGNGDHDNGAGREYSWWLTQKMTDAYHVKGRFTPVFSYERSVSYPHGHRNCVFARRGIRTLPRLGEEDPEKRVGGVHADDTKMLYRYLHELGGICASHTSATGMGTDWRDHDSAVEPIVEIYQGDRMSYEMEGAPRAGFDPKDNKYPPNIAGWYPKGFINNALKMGHKLGFQSSSDHWSTHTSFCIVLAERHDREAIVDALRKRHCYGATDNVILDVRSGTHVMGDEFKTGDAPTLEIKVQGTGLLAKVEVLRDCEVVKTFEPGKAGFADKWTDPKPEAGKHYYYVRVQQADGELAWGSPMWIEYAK